MLRSKLKSAYHATCLGPLHLGQPGKDVVGTPAKLVIDVAITLAMLVMFSTGTPDLFAMLYFYPIIGWSKFHNPI
jgi:hypothetical protein